MIIWIKFCYFNYLLLSIKYRFCKIRIIELGEPVDISLVILDTRINYFYIKVFLFDIFYI